MRKLAKAVGLLVALSALTGASLKAQPPVDPICPACIIDYKCCIRGNHASCIPASQAC